MWCQKAVLLVWLLAMVANIARSFDPEVAVRGGAVFITVEDSTDAYIEKVDQYGTVVAPASRIITEADLDAKLVAFKAEILAAVPAPGISEARVEELITAAVPPPGVSEGRVEEMITNLVESGDYSTSPLITANILTEKLDEFKTQVVVPAINDKVRTDDDIVDVVDGELERAESKLKTALDLKEDKSALDPCSCVAPGTISSLLSSISYLQNATGDNSDTIDGHKNCAKYGLHLQNGECVQSTIVDCTDTIANLPDGMQQQGPCTGDTTWGGESCTVECKRGYEPQTGEYQCALNGWYGEDLNCIPIDCVDVSPVLVPGLEDTSDACVDIAVGDSCILSCAAGYVKEGTLDATCVLNDDTSPTAPHVKFDAPTGSCVEDCGDSIIVGAEGCDDGNEIDGDGCSSSCQVESGYSCTTPGSLCTILTHCNGVPDGPNKIYPMGTGSQAVNVVCNQGYFIIDPSRDSNWASYFNDWNTYSSPAGVVHGPSSSNLINNRYNTWREWDKFDFEAHQYTISFDCSTCAENFASGRAYYASGNYHGCYYYNRNCDMGSDGACRTCVNNYGSTNGGACAFISTSPNSAYRASATESHYKYNNCQSHWWHTAPSLGGAGKACVCANPTLPAP